MIQQMIARQARLHPDKPAVRSATSAVTFGELDRRANHLAWQLRALGAGPETRVANCQARSPESVVGLLGIVKCGAAPVLVDPALPADRIGVLLRDSEAIAAISEAPLDGVRSLTVGQAGRDDEPPVALHPENAAHVVYTSGSTGRPKGVVARHETVEHCVRWARQAFSLTERDRMTWVSAPGFGVGLVNELWPALATGCTVELPDAGTLLFPDRLRDWLVDRRITVTQLVTTLAESLFELGWPDPCPLRLLLVTGEPMRREPPGTLPFDVVLTYGSTETTHITSAGYPVDAVQVRLVGDEIYVAGPGLARGYLGDPALTAARWLPDPFATTPGARMYRTGDLGRRRPGGGLEVLGRADRQVKVRGQRVNLDEVEAAVAGRPGVREAAVVMGNAGIVAYLAGEAGAPAVHQGLKAALPQHMLPVDYISLTELPRTPSGKLDRAALPEPRRARDAVAAAPRQPAGPVEHRLAEIWSELLGLDEIGADDDFFELGGHSLIAVQVVTAIRDRMGVRIDLPDFYAGPTIAATAALVAGRLPK